MNARAAAIARLSESDSLIDGQSVPADPSLSRPRFFRCSQSFVHHVAEYESPSRSSVVPNRLSPRAVNWLGSHKSVQINPTTSPASLAPQHTNVEFAISQRASHCEPLFLPCARPRSSTYVSDCLRPTPPHRLRPSLTLAFRSPALATHALASAQRTSTLRRCTGAIARRASQSSRPEPERFANVRVGYTEYTE